MRFAPVNNPPTTCYRGLQDGTEMGFSILSDIFLKAPYVVYDAEYSDRTILQDHAHRPRAQTT